MEARLPREALIRKSKEKGCIPSEYSEEDAALCHARLETATVIYSAVTKQQLLTQSNLSGLSTGDLTGYEGPGLSLTAPRRVSLAVYVADTFGVLTNSKQVSDNRTVLTQNVHVGVNIQTTNGIVSIAGARYSVVPNGSFAGKLYLEAVPASNND